MITGNVSSTVMCRGRQEQEDRYGFLYFKEVHGALTLDVTYSHNICLSIFSGCVSCCDIIGNKKFL